MSMRIRGAKTELEDAGESTEGMAESTASLRAEMLALSGVDIMLNEDTFKSTYQIMDELSKKWEDLSDIQQATIIELVAGKHQGNVFSSLMANFQTARDALDTSLGSSGSAMREHAKWSESLEARLNKLKSAWQSLSLTFMNSDFLKAGISFLTKFVDILDKILSNLGGFGTVGLGVAIASVSNYFKSLKEGQKTIDDIIRSIEELNTSLAGSASATDISTEANMRNVASETAEAEANAVSAASEAAEAETNAASTATEVAETEANAINTVSEAAEVEANAASTAAELAEAEANVVSTATEMAEVEANAASAASEFAEAGANAASAASEAAESAANLGGSVAAAGGAATKAAGGFAAFATSTAGVVTGIALLVAALGIAYNQYKKNKEAAAEARQEAITASDDYLKAASSFEQSYVKYSGKSDLTSEEEAELTSAIQGVTGALEDKTNALQNVVNSSSDYIASLEKISQAEREIANEKAVDKLEKASEGLYEAVNGWSKLDGSEVDVAFSTIAIRDAADNEAYKIAREIGKEYYSTIRVNGRTGYEQAGFKLDTNASLDEIVDYYDMLNEYKDRLKSAGLENTSEYTNTTKAIEQMSEAISVYIDGVYDAAKAQYQLNNNIPKTVDEYLKMRESILSSDNIKNLSVETKKMMANRLDSEYGKVFDLSDVQIQARRLIGILSEYGDNEANQMETFLNMQTAVNGNNCTVGQYISELNKVNDMTAGWSEESKNELNLSFGLDDDAIKRKYDDISNYFLKKVDTSGMSTEQANLTKRVASQRIKSFLGDLTAEELSAVIDIKTEIDWENANIESIFEQIKKQVELNNAMSFKIDIKAETEGIEALNTAISESKSATGLASESIAALKDRYKDLDGYDAAALFEETANGIKINSTELANLEKEYKDFNKQQADQTLKTLKQEYDELTNQIDSCSDGQENLNDLYAKRDTILEQINNVATLAAQYAGLTSAYNEWLNAQEAGQDRDMYESILSGREDIEDEMSRGWLDDAAVEYLELLSGKELSTAGIDAQIAAYKELSKTIEGSKYSIWDFFTEDDDGNATSEGVYNFFDAIKTATNETAAWVDENGKYHFDFEGFQHDGKTGDAAIASILGTSEELVQILLRAAEDAGFVVNIEGEYTDLANASDSVQELNKQLKEVGATNYTFNVKATDLDYVNEQIVEAKSALKYFEDRDGKINLDDSDVRAAASIFATLIYRKSDLGNPTLMSIDVSEPTTKLEEVIGLAQQLKDASANLEIQTSIGADTTEAQTEVDSLLAQISADGYADIVADLSIDTTSVDSAIASINAISSEQMISLGLDTSKIDGYVAPDQNATVKFDKDSTEVDEYDPPNFTRTVTFYKDSYEVDIYNPKNFTRTVTYEIKTVGGIVEVNGTANVNGTAFANGTVDKSGRAFKQGNWGIKDSGSALGGELGTEVLVRDGRWYTIGDNGAEFFQYKKGDIIFNHKQTEELFANGRVTSGGGRGKAIADGTAFSTGIGGARKNMVFINDGGGGKSSIEIIEESGGSWGGGGFNPPNSNKGKGGGGGGGGSSDAEDDYKEKIDWIETAIDRIERAIDKLDLKATSVYRAWSERNTALADEVEKVREEIDLQQRAYERYVQEAESVGLSEEYAAKVRDGTIDIEKINDEELKKKIDEYKQW